MEKYGKILGVPYDFRIPTPSRIKERMWNPEDPRVFTPRVFGAGWDINFATLREKNRKAFVIALAAYSLIYLNGIRGLCKRLKGLKSK
jgi:hypothetical protein